MNNGTYTLEEIFALYWSCTEYFVHVALRPSWKGDSQGEMDIGHGMCITWLVFGGTCVPELL